MLYPKWNWWTQPKRQLWPPVPLTFLWPKSLGSLSKHWLGGTTWDPIYNSPSATSPTRTQQNLPTPWCDQPIIGMENIMWGFNPSIWRQAWWISYSKWKITDCNCRSKWNGALTTSMPPSKRSWESGNVWRWCIQMWWNPRWWGVANFPLLCEVQLSKTGDRRSTVEPLHHQWLKIRGNQLDIIEVEIATPNGLLAMLPPGKTIVIIGLKQL